MVAKKRIRRRLAQAGLLAVCTTVQLAQGAPGGGASSTDSSSKGKVVITDRAREQFEIGVRLLEDPSGTRIAEAYDAFKAAYADSPSPKILGNLGLCAMMLERDGEAIDAYERYRVEVTDAQQAERSRIDNDLVILSGRAGTVELTVEPPQGVLIDERIPPTGATVTNRYPVTASPLTMRFRAGRHRLRVELADHAPATVEFELGAGAQERHKLVLERKSAAPATSAAPGPKSPPAQSRAAQAVTAGPNGSPPSSPGAAPGRSVPTSAWAMLAVTGVLGAGTIVTGALALDRKATYDQYSTGGSRKEAEAWRSEGEALNITTDVLLITTAASAVVTLVLFLVGSDETADETATAAGAANGLGEPRVGVAPWVGSRAGGVGLSAGF